jgi:hypothetical protein
LSKNIISSAIRTVLCAGLIYGAAVALAFAIDDATLSIEHVAGDGWAADGISVRLERSAKSTPAQVSIAQLLIPKLHLQLAHSAIHCDGFEALEDFFVCNDATIALTLPELGAQRLHAQLRYDRRDGAIKTNLKGLRVGEGVANLSLFLNGGHETIDAQFDHVSVEQLLKLATRFGVTLPLAAVSGTISGTLHAQTRRQEFDTVAVNLTLEQFSANNASGSIATDKLSATIDGQLRASTEGFNFRAEVRSQQGQAYFDPIFLDTSVHGLYVQARGKWSTADGLIADAFTVRHQGVLTASGSARLDLHSDQPLRELKVANAQMLFPGAYETYMQAFVANDAMKALRTSGAATISAEVANGKPTAFELRSEGFNADGGKTLRLDALKGGVSWQSNELQRDAVGVESFLSWSGASVFGLEIGSAPLRFQVDGHSFRLLEPAHIPLLDGALDVETLRIRNFAQSSVAFLIDATLKPISMPQLCRAFGWPEFGGHIGGAISKLRMRDGVITLGTTLNGQVLDGAVAVRDLRLEQPFGNWPRFHASVSFDNLDLQQVTSAFSFGRITGKLSGVIDGLELFNWSAVAFDARFFTPPTDQSKHRISQRAVENIGSLGGGGSAITAALSSGFLRFFADFNYDRIGLSCRLANDVCLMDGIAPVSKSGGYYLVKGSGVPRIDVIGNSRRVDWPRLVQQLKAATEADTVVVK